MDSGLENTPLVPKKCFDLRTADGRDRCQAYIESIVSKWHEIESIPPEPIGLPRFLAPMLNEPGNFFSWVQQGASGRWHLEVANPLPVLFEPWASEEQQLKAEVSAITIEHVSALCGSCGSVLDIVMSLGNVQECSAAQSAPAFGTVYKRLTEWTNTGFSERESCPQPAEIALLVYSGLVAECARCQEVL